MLRRIVKYGTKVFGLAQLVEKIEDRRRQPRIPTRVVVWATLAMHLARLGSLNALEQTKASSFWSKWLGAKLPSADSMGRITAGMNPDSIREAQHGIYARLKRNKALQPLSGGLTVLVLDGHESHATYRRRCDGCLERKRGKRTQYYHQQVTAMLLGANFPVLLDAEAQRPGEDEITTAIRLLQRLLKNYPRAFDVVVGDALYADTRFFKAVVGHGKDLLAVLKANRKDLLLDAKALFAQMEPVELTGVADSCQTWDLSDFTTWSQVSRSVRVVRSLERRNKRRQLDDQLEETCSDWMWVTTLSAHQANTATVVRLGHARWDIENRGFNETVNRWHADHVHKHDATAILAFWLQAMLAFNLFHAFYFRNLKPVAWRRYSLLHVSRCMASDLYGDYRDPALALARPP